jgi:hypothetical protein
VKIPEYKSPTTVTRTEDRTPEQLFPNEFHASHSSAGGKWSPSEQFPTYELQFAFILATLRKIQREKGKQCSETSTD